MTGMPRRLTALSPRSIVAAIVDSRLDSIFSNAGGTSMPDKWPSSLNEQLSAVLAAPIPFFIAVALITWAAWHAWQWRFKAVFQKQKELYELSRSEVDHWKTNAELTAKALSEKIDLLEKQQNQSEETKKQLASAKEGVTELKTQLQRLGQANSSSTGFIPGTQIRHAVGVAPPPEMDWTSSGWKPRYPTDITGRSG